MPIADGKLWQRGGDGSGKFVIAFTGEKFHSKNDAACRMNDYKKRKWCCRHFPNKDASHTFEEALNKEKEALQIFFKRFPSLLLADMCKAAHHTYGNIESLVRSISHKLGNKYYRGEAVVVMGKDRKNSEGIIYSIDGDADVTLSSNNKENSFCYSIELKSGEKIENIIAEKIQRAVPITENDITTFLLLVAHRKGNTSPWVLDESIRKEFDIPNKFHSLFLGDAAKRTNCTWPNQTNDIDRKAHMSNAKSSVLITISVDEKIKRKLKVEKFSSSSFQKSDPVVATSRDAELEVKIVAEAICSDSNNTSGAELHRKHSSEHEGRGLKMHSKIPGVHKFQSSLAKYIIPTTTKVSNAKTLPRMLGARRLELLQDQLTKALIAHDSNSFYQRCTFAARSLPLSVIESVDNEVLRYVLLKKYYQLKNSTKTRKMSLGKKKTYKKCVESELKRDPVLEIKLRELFSRRLDDLRIPTRKFLPEFEIIEDSANFASYLAVSQFMHIFRFFFSLKCNTVSAEVLADATKTGREGFLKITGPYMVALLRTILKDKQKENNCVRDTYLHKAHLTLETVSEITRYVLMAKHLSSLNKDDHSDNSHSQNFEKCEVKASTSSTFVDQEDDLQPLICERMKCVSFYKLAAVEQIRVLEWLIQCVHDTKSFNLYIMRSLKLDIQRFQNVKTVAENRVKDLEVRFEILQKNSCNLQNETGRGARTWSKMLSKRLQAEADLAVATEKLEEIKKVCCYSRRVSALGCDRFHRRYWFFANSPNKGIFIERGWWGSAGWESGLETNGVKDSDVEFSKSLPKMELSSLPKRISTLDDYLKSGVSWPLGFESNDWYHIKDEETLRLLCSNLLTNGYRESSLLNSIKGKWSEIVSSLKDLKEKETLQMETCAGEKNLFKKEFKTLKRFLQQGHLITEERSGSASARLESADTFDAFKNLVLELTDSISQDVFKKFSMETWKSDVTEASTFHRLNFLVSFLNTKWLNAFSNEQKDNERMSNVLNLKHEIME